MFVTTIYYKMKQLWDYVMYPSKYYAKKYAKRYAQEYSASEIKKAMYDINKDDSRSSVDSYYNNPYNDFY